jgi:antibiotic biosynthesis monooxygenase (ABM) superfamily enzyme
MQSTVVISQSVRPGCEAPYAEWQQGLPAGARGLEAFRGSEVFPAVEGVQDEWVVVVRFDPPEHLSAWLDSPIRERWLGGAEPLVEGPGHKQVMARQQPEAEPVTVVISEKIKPEHEDEYRSWQDGITAEVQKFDGFQGTEVLAPKPGVQDEWVVVFRFDSAENLEAWLGSDARRAWMQKAEPFFEDVRMYRVGGGFPGWFPLGDAPGVGVPEWKQAMAVQLGLYPTVMLLLLFLSPLVRSWPMALATFTGNVASVILLTWLVMPIVNRLLGPWLKPPQGHGAWLS